MRVREAGCCSDSYFAPKSVDTETSQEFIVSDFFIIASDLGLEERRLLIEHQDTDKPAEEFVMDLQFFGGSSGM